MKNIRINTLHRYVGIVIAPFIVLQTISGLLLGFGLFRRGMTGHGGEAFQASGSILYLRLRRARNKYRSL
jgi:hypothetical protein